MANIASAVVDGLLLRCPRCHKGPMFRSLFDMHPSCSACGLPFESASGEITGGMAINLVVTEVVAVAVGGYFALFTDVPVMPLLLTLGFFTVVFPILFYRISRAIWAGFLFVTGDNAEGD